MARLFPRSLRDVVEKAARPIMKKRGFAESSILLDWPQIVGAALAGHTRPVKIGFPRGETANGNLTIACTPAFAPELQLLTPVLLDKLATHVGYRAIARITIEQHHMAIPPAPPKPASNTTPTPETFSDDPLENALRRFEKIRNQRGDNTSKQQ